MYQISQPLRIARGSGGVNVLVVPATEHLPPLDAVKLGVTRDGEEMDPAGVELDDEQE
jgi:hypothetical protein